MSGEGEKSEPEIPDGAADSTLSTAAHNNPNDESQPPSQTEAEDPSSPSDTLITSEKCGAAEENEKVEDQVDKMAEMVESKEEKEIMKTDDVLALGDKTAATAEESTTQSPPPPDEAEEGKDEGKDNDEDHSSKPVEDSSDGPDKIMVDVSVETQPESGKENTTTDEQTNEKQEETTADRTHVTDSEGITQSQDDDANIAQQDDTVSYTNGSDVADASVENASLTSKNPENEVDIDDDSDAKVATKTEGYDDSDAKAEAKTEDGDDESVGEVQIAAAKELNATNGKDDVDSEFSKYTRMSEDFESEAAKEEEDGMEDLKQSQDIERDFLQAISAPSVVLPDVRDRVLASPTDMAMVAAAGMEAEDVPPPSPSEVDKVAANNSLDASDDRKMPAVKRSVMPSLQQRDSADMDVSSNTGSSAAAGADKKKRKRADSSSDDTSWSSSGSESDSEGESDPADRLAAEQRSQLPAVKQGRLEFTLNGPVQSQLICELCMGYFREPYRITTCLHTFCKSCLLLAFERAGNLCPVCKTYLGRLADSNEYPFKPDRLLQHLMDKVLFPELAAADEEAEAEFYASLGIQRKVEFQETRTKKKKASKSTSSEKTRTISFQLVPGPGRSAPQRPFLETDSTMTISQLKKYLQQHEQMSVSEVYCLGTVLGNEWSIDFVKKTIWKRRSACEVKLLSLEYR